MQIISDLFHLFGSLIGVGIAIDAINYFVFNGKSWIWGKLFERDTHHKG